MLIQCCVMRPEVWRDLQSVSLSPSYATVVTCLSRLCCPFRVQRYTYLPLKTNIVRSAGTPGPHFSSMLPSIANFLQN